MKLVNNITELVGNTPMVKLTRMVKEDFADVYVKLEYFNPGSSIKDRIALNMVEKAEELGLLKPDSVIIEPTSGNTGIGLAMVGAAKGYKVILVMPDTMSMERRSLLKAYGAELILTPGEQGMNGAITKAKALNEENSHYFMPQQFENLHNPDVHREKTAIEILNQVGDDLDMFVAGVGTGGTITGVSEILKKRNEETKIIAVEPINSPVLSGGKPGPHKIQGIGAGFIPGVLNTDMIDEVEKVHGDEAIETARRLAREEGLLVGISSGAAVFAALKKAEELGAGKKIVVIAPDNGERYLSTGIFE